MKAYPVAFFGVVLQMLSISSLQAQSAQLENQKINVMSSACDLVICYVFIPKPNKLEPELELELDLRISNNSFFNCSSPDEYEEILGVTNLADIHLIPCNRALKKLLLGLYTVGDRTIVDEIASGALRRLFEPYSGIEQLSISYLIFRKLKSTDFDGVPQLSALSLWMPLNFEGDTFVHMQRAQEKFSLKLICDTKNAAPPLESVIWFQSQSWSLSFLTCQLSMSCRKFSSFLSKSAQNSDLPQLPQTLSMVFLRDSTSSLSSGTQDNLFLSSSCIESVSESSTAKGDYFLALQNAFKMTRLEAQQLIDTINEPLSPETTTTAITTTEISHDITSKAIQKSTPTKNMAKFTTISSIIGVQFVNKTLRKPISTAGSSENVAFGWWFWFIWFLLGLSAINGLLLIGVVLMLFCLCRLSSQKKEAVTLSKVKTSKNGALILSSQEIKTLNLKPVAL